MPKQIEYAYECESTLTPNQLEIVDNGGGTFAEKYVIRLGIHYELKDANKTLLGKQIIQHYSEPSDTLRTAEQVTEWLCANRSNFILADKSLLAGYGG